MMMEWMSVEFFSALLAIIMIDLVLAGDNAVVIGLAARNLPPEQQRKVIILGTAGAIVVRVIATLLIVWLLRIPGLLLVGGLLLVWISYKLLIDEKKHEIKAQPSLGKAIGTIILADSLMGIDNVLAVAGAAHGSFALVIIGLLISVPIMIYGSKYVIKLVNRFPSVIYGGSAVLAWTAGKMITDEPILGNLFKANPALKWIVIAVIVAGVLAAGKWMNQKHKSSHTREMGA